MVDKCSTHKKKIIASIFIHMVYTNPGAISNSGANYFVNQRAKIEKINLNLIANGDSNYYWVQMLNNQDNTKKNNLSNQNDYKFVLAQQKSTSKSKKLNKFKDNLDD